MEVEEQDNLINSKTGHKENKKKTEMSFENTYIKYKKTLRESEREIPNLMIRFINILLSQTVFSFLLALLCCYNVALGSFVASHQTIYIIIF